MPDIVAVAADHGGYELKTALLPELKALGFEVLDLGTNNAESVDYPNFANAVAVPLGTAGAERGLLTFATSIGMSIAAIGDREVACALEYDVRTAHPRGRQREATA